MANYYATLSGSTDTPAVYLKDNKRIFLDTGQASPRINWNFFHEAMFLVNS